MLSAAHNPLAKKQLLLSFRGHHSASSYSTYWFVICFKSHVLPDTTLPLLFRHGTKACAPSVAVIFLIFLQWTIWGSEFCSRTLLCVPFPLQSVCWTVSASVPASWHPQCLPAHPLFIFLILFLSFIQLCIYFKFGKLYTGLQFFTFCLLHVLHKEKILVL